jgi:hypothetical protein
MENTMADFCLNFSFSFKPPIVSFRTKINLPCVNSRGEVARNSLYVLKTWQYHNKMEGGKTFLLFFCFVFFNSFLIEVLLQIKAQMAANRKLPQPADESMY